MSDFIDLVGLLAFSFGTSKMRCMAKETVDDALECAERADNSGGATTGWTVGAAILG